MVDKANSRMISFRVTRDVQQLNRMLEARGPTATEFFQPLTAAAIILHERGDDPVLTLTTMPLGGLAAIETERAATSQLVVASHRALSEMQTAIGALWPVMVGVGTSASGPEMDSSISDELPITISQAYKLCDDLTRAVHTFTKAWIAADSTLDQTRA